MSHDIPIVIIHYDVINYYEPLLTIIHYLGLTIINYCDITTMNYH